MEIDGNLYDVNVYENKIGKLLKDQIGDYDISKINEEQIEGNSVVWGSDASVNPDGTRLVFFSNRNSFTAKNLNGQMWKKDLLTGIEEPVVEGGYHIIGWGKSNEIYIKRSDQIFKVDLDTNKESEIITFSLNEAISFPYLIHQSDYGSVNITNVDTMIVKVLKIESLNQINFIRTVDGSSWAMISFSPDRAKPESTIAILNMETSEVRQLDEPENSFVIDGRWLNEHQLLINTRTRGSDEEITYVIDQNQ
ncbi:hypothetical protein [Paenibacillus sp. BC26]|uniref:hypothetical protein n=1 Tax=Paenibacillus sp. BC26 TaxID=1881032 RepID=UPI0008E5343B|nr:hypothetical protein [Paenibacillus sp. BC26]SFS76640.1 hypothetical protein SAMN05428962_2732 [Paenibacillus sp. BC26]